MSATLQERNIPVARPSIGEEEEQAVMAALRSGLVSQGPNVAEFERRFAEYVGARNAVAVTSCTTFVVHGGLDADRASARHLRRVGRRLLLHGRGLRFRLIH